MEAHDFIDSSYWKSHFEEVRALLPQAEIMVSENTDTGVLEDYRHNGIYSQEFWQRQEYRFQEKFGRQLSSFAKTGQARTEAKGI